MIGSFYRFMNFYVKTLNKKLECDWKATMKDEQTWSAFKI